MTSDVTLHEHSRSSQTIIPYSTGTQASISNVDGESAQPLPLKKTHNEASREEIGRGNGRDTCLDPLHTGRSSST